MSYVGKLKCEAGMRVCVPSLAINILQNSFLYFYFTRFIKPSFNFVHLSVHILLQYHSNRHASVKTFRDNVPQKIQQEPESAQVD